MSEDIGDAPRERPGGPASDLSLEARVSAARTLLEDAPRREYDATSASQRALIQEAIEFLGRVERGLRGEIRGD